MPKRCDDKDRRIVRALLEGKTYKQIVFECRTSEGHISLTKRRYLTTRTLIVLNARGERLMKVHEQLSLKL